MRSGSTMLQNFISQSTSVGHLVGEAEHFFWLIHAYILGGQQFAQKTRYFFESKNEYVDYHRKLATQYIERVRHIYGNKRLVLRAPWFTRYLPHVNELLPDSLHVVIVRDPRDIVASLLRVGERQRLRGEPTDFVKENILAIVNEINLNYMTLLNQRKLFTGRIHFLRYEDFVQRPQETAETLGQFLSLHDLAHIVSSKVMELSGIEYSEMQLSPFFSEYWGKGIVSSRIGSYKENLTTAEVSRITQTASNLMRAFSYS